MASPGVTARRPRVNRGVACTRDRLRGVRRRVVGVPSGGTRVVDQRGLGVSGLQVPRLSLGAMTFGSRMPPISHVSAADAEVMVERAIAAGINFVDTADAYGGGESEEILAPILARHGDELLVATK